VPRLLLTNPSTCRLYVQPLILRKSRFAHILVAALLLLRPLASAAQDATRKSLRKSPRLRQA
jgi:hypothetical protein